MATPILENYPQKIISSERELKAVRKEKVVDSIECHGLPEIQESSFSDAQV